MGLSCVGFPYCNGCGLALPFKVILSPCLCILITAHFCKSVMHAYNLKKVALFQDSVIPLVSW